MAFVQNFPFFTIILALSGGVICSVLKGKHARNYCLFILTCILVMTCMTFMHVYETGEAYVYMMGHFSAPWGNEIRVGVLECLMAIVFLVVMILSLFGGMHHIEKDVEESKYNLYFTMISLLTSSLLALVYTNDLFTGYVFVEINTMGSCALVMVRYRSGKALVATLRYMFMSLLGSGLFLLGICILYGITGHLLMESIATSVMNLIETGMYQFPLAVVVGLFSMGLAIKSACFPFHTWLPNAYDNATVATSSISSGLVLKGYVFFLIKIFYRMFDISLLFEAKAINVLFVFGACAMLYGSYKAMKEQSLKRMLAYSSVAQMGYVYLGIGLGSVFGFAAAVIQMIVHSITKPMLFTATAGFLDVSDGSDRFTDLKGAALRDKLSGVAFVVGSLSMIGIPFFAGFVSKVFLSSAAIENMSLKMIISLIVLAISTLMNACYFIPAMYTLYTSHSKKNQKVHHSIAFVVTIILLIGINFFVGMNSNMVMDLIQQGFGMFR